MTLCFVFVAYASFMSFRSLEGCSGQNYCDPPSMAKPSDREFSARYWFYIC